MKTVFTCFTILLGAGWILSPAASAERLDPTQKWGIYSHYIEYCISKCNSKASRNRSKCRNIREEASLYRIKASFLATYKQRLINDLMENQVGLKTHQVQTFINSEFFKNFRRAVQSMGATNMSTRK